MAAQTPPHLKGEESTRATLKTFGAREACRQDVAGRYLQVTNDLDYAEGMLLTSRQSLAANKAGLAKARAKFAASKARYHGNPSDFMLKDAMDSDFFVVRQLLSQARDIEKIITQQTAVKDRAKAEQRRLDRGIRKVFRVTSKKYRMDIRYKQPCGRYTYICPPTKAEAKLIREIFKGQSISPDCQKFLGNYQYQYQYQPQP